MILLLDDREFTISINKTLHLRLCDVMNNLFEAFMLNEEQPNDLSRHE